MRVPYYQQVFEYTCGPAALRMVAAFLRRPIGRLQAITLCKTTATHGTTRLNLIQAARSQNLRVHAHSNATLREIDALLRKKIPVIVNYREPQDEEGHYSVIIKVTNTHVVLADPYHGPKLKISRREFMSRWHGKHLRAHRRWMMGVSVDTRHFTQH